MVYPLSNIAGKSHSGLYYLSYQLSRPDFPAFFLPARFAEIQNTFLLLFIFAPHPATPYLNDYTIKMSFVNASFH